MPLKLAPKCPNQNHKFHILQWSIMIAIEYNYSIRNQLKLKGIDRYGTFEK